MALTLEQMLALLADNTSGDIGPDDLRAIVTDLYNAANKINVQQYYTYDSGVPDNGGKCGLDAWSLSATTLYATFYSPDAFTPTQFDSALIAAGDAHISLEVTGALVFHPEEPDPFVPAYWEIPVTALEVVGDEPILFGVTLVFTQLPAA